MVYPGTGAEIKKKYLAGYKKRTSIFTELKMYCFKTFGIYDVFQQLKPANVENMVSS
jgi:hypothetical protein